MRASPIHPRRLRVMESFVAPHAETNPHSVLLVESLRPLADVEYFSWRAALRGDYDVFHLHWPEVKVRGRTRWRSAARSAAFLALLLRLRVGRPALVRTLHDLQPHEEQSVLGRWLIRLSERWTTLWICLNRTTPPPTDAPQVVIPLGHFRDRFDQLPTAAPIPGRIVHFGLLRPYKGVDSLLDAFARLQDPDLSLRIVGKSMDDGLTSLLRSATAADGRITWVEGFASDETLALEIGRAELVVLPFTAVTNSGSLLLALSLNRPVLIPSGDASVELAEETGSDWVQLYDGELTPDLLHTSLERVRATDRAASPDMSSRDWDRIGAEHVAAFEAAVTERRHRRRGHPVRHGPSTSS